MEQMPPLDEESVIQYIKEIWEKNDLDSFWKIQDYIGDLQFSYSVILTNNVSMVHYYINEYVLTNPKYSPMYEISTYFVYTIENKQNTDVLEYLLSNYPGLLDMNINLETLIENAEIQYFMKSFLKNYGILKITGH